MDEQYQAYLLAQIREYFYKKFDSFMIEKWSGSPLEDPILDQFFHAGVFWISAD